MRASRCPLIFITNRGELHVSAIGIRGDGRGALTYFGFLATTGFLIVTTVAHAECNSPGFNTSGKFCDNCRYEGSMAVVRDQPCERPYRPNPNAPGVEFLSNRVIQRAKHGIAGVNGKTFAYAPSKGYVGPDEFAVEVAYRQGKDAGKFFVHFNVAVQ
jgi:hypothetical protein